MFEWFTTESRAVVLAAQQAARGFEHSYVGTEHLLLGLLDAPAPSAAARVLAASGLDSDSARAQVLRLVGPGESLGDVEAAALQSIGIDLDAVQAKVEDTFGAGVLQQRAGRIRSGPPLTRRAKRSLQLALQEARTLGDDAIRPDHVLLGLLREGKGIAALVIAASSPLPTVRERLLAELGRAA